MKKLKSDNKGMALITVIVVIGFVAALVSILLMTTLVNFKMKATNERSKDTFYSAEQVLDEINIGLQRKVSDAVSSSYVQIMEDYGSYDNDVKKEMMMTRYYEKLWDSLEDKTSTSGHNKYDVSLLEAMLKDSTRWHAADDYGAIITAVDSEGNESKSGDMITYTKEGVVLKNLKIYYKDSMGFVSVIQTDIRLQYPEFEFATSSMIADITEYSFIADGGCTIDGSGTLDIDGNVYTNDFIASNDRAVSITDTKKFISKYDINIQNGSSFTTGKDAEIWAQNIKAKTSDVSIEGYTYVSNDLNIQGKKSVVSGKGSNVKIKGVYMGYGCSTADGDLSSAILVNGTGASLDLSELSGITVAGHAYVGSSNATDALKKVYNGSSLYNARPEDMDETKDVYTGQSLAVKSDQLVYLVPAEAIGVDNNTGRSMYNKNPLTKEEYNKIVAAVGANAVNKTDYVMVSDQVVVTSVGEDLTRFLKYTNQPGQAKATPEVYYHEIPVSDPNVGSLVYLYLVFNDEQAANDYYNLYFNLNQDDVEKYTDLYVEKVKFPKNTNQLLTYVTAGNILIDTTDTEAKAFGRKFEVQNATERNAASTMVTVDNDYRLRFTALCSKLVENYSELKGLSNKDGGMSISALNIDKDVKANQRLFENIVDIERLDEFCADALSYADGTDVGGGLILHKNEALKHVWFEDAEGNIAYVCGTDSSPLLINNSNVHLVICGSDKTVTVNVDEYKGLIICNGKLEFSNSAVKEAIADPGTVRSLLQAGYDKDGDTHAIASVLTDGSDFVYRTGSSTDDAMDTSLKGLITYENWKKQ